MTTTPTYNPLRLAITTLAQTIATKAKHLLKPTSAMPETTPMLAAEVGARVIAIADELPVLVDEEGDTSFYSADDSIAR